MTTYRYAFLLAAACGAGVLTTPVRTQPSSDYQVLVTLHQGTDVLAHRIKRDALAAADFDNNHAWSFASGLP